MDNFNEKDTVTSPEREYARKALRATKLIKVFLAIFFLAVLATFFVMFVL